jgi:squalene synthase HpnC
MYETAMAVNHYENFPVASLLLPRRLRHAIINIYRFARSADDIADEGTISDAQRLQTLASYRHQLDHIATGSKTVTPALPPEFSSNLAAVFDPLALTIAQHQLPIAPFYDLLSAFEQDVRIKRYANMSAVLDYCTRSANPIGHLMLHLYHAASAENMRDANAICTGLQCVNFWQDIRLDWHKGRLYLPQAVLHQHGVSEEDIAQCRLGPNWAALMFEQIAQARALLHSGANLPRRLPRRLGLDLRLIIQGGLRILERIEHVHYDVFMQRPQLGAKDWGLILWRACR